MTKNTKSYPLIKKSIIIDTYDNDPSREGDIILISIMSNGKKITILEIYNLMVDGFKKQEEFNKTIVSAIADLKKYVDIQFAKLCKENEAEFAKLRKDNNLK